MESRAVRQCKRRPVVLHLTRCQLSVLRRDPVSRLRGLLDEALLREAPSLLLPAVLPEAALPEAVLPEELPEARFL